VSSSRAQSDESLRNRLGELILGDPWRASILQTLWRTDREAWVTGGFVRNRVWDDIESNQLPTPLDDVDVVVFRNADIGIETELVARLSAAAPTVPWSVRNQARMHTRSGDQPYPSLEDAIRCFPDTASAIAVRLSRHSRLSIIAPFGLRDLFAGVGQPTNVACARPQRYVERLKQKEAEWLLRWPHLTIQRSDSSQTGGACERDS
jgi:uncharacterized protein